jgi:phosphotriesterase-related protein
MMVQTVTGPIPLDRLGRTLMHEHILVSFDGTQFDPTVSLDRPALVKEAVRRLTQLRVEHGVDTFVDPCPIELGRDVALMKEVSERSQMQIVCTTGFFFGDMGLPAYWRFRTVEEIAELYIREITKGVNATGIRAGAIKAASGAPFISELEKKFLAAASLAQKATGVPIITHTQDGVGGPEQQQEFAGHGVPLHRCLIGHSCGNPDPAYHRRIVDGGSYVGFDRIGMLRMQSDEVRADNLALLVRGGFGAQVMMSMDRHCGWHGKLNRQLTPQQLAELEELRAQGDHPAPFTHLFTRFLPMLRERGVGEADIVSILEENPRRIFAGEPFPQRLLHGDKDE